MSDRHCCQGGRNVKKRIVIVVFVALLLGVIGAVYVAQKKVRGDEVYYSGTIEATDSNLAFQVPGHVTAVQAVEGRTVEKGQVLAELESAEFQVRVAQARANLDRALKVKGQLEDLLVIYQGVLPADVRRAEAGLAAAENTLIDARKDNVRYQELFSRGVVSQRERDAVNLSYENARSRLSEAEAVVKQAQSNLRKIDSTKKDIEAAQAQIDLARANLDQASIQLGYTRLTAPYAGVITSRNVEPGEVVSPGREIITLSDLSRVDLKIFVDETRIAAVKPGQRVDVQVDTFPGKFFKGHVSYISPEAEFTPKIIQTHKERVKLVYLVKVSIPNPKFQLKTGIPADAYLR